MAKNPLFTFTKSDREGFRKAYVPSRADLGHANRKLGRGIGKVLHAIYSSPYRRRT